MTNEELLRQLEADGRGDLAQALKAAMRDEPPKSAANALSRDDSERMEPDNEAAEEDGKPDKKKPAADEAEKSLTERIWARISERLGRKEAGEGETSFKVVGNHWLAIWSNDFKDREGEIFTRKAIDEYIARVDTGIVPKPELWDSHIPGTRSGQAEFVGRHEHFVIALGTFDDTPKGQAAKAYYQKHAKEQGISHGYKFRPSQRDGGAYHAFNTFEISPLQRGVEANRFTSLEGIKEMALTEQKKKRVFDIFGKEVGAQILADLDEKGKALEDLNVEFKEFAVVTETPAPEDEDALSKALKELVPDLIEADADNAQANLKMAKVVAQQQTDLSAIKASLQKIEAFISQTPKRASKAAETEIDPDDEDDAKDFLSRFENGEVDEKLVKALGASAFDQSDFRKNLSQHGINQH